MSTRHLASGPMPDKLSDKYSLHLNTRTRDDPFVGGLTSNDAPSEP
jgi:hypothetical protein